MPRTLFTEGRLRAFEYMMTQVPNGTKDEDTGKDDADGYTNNARRIEENDRP